MLATLGGLITTDAGIKLVGVIIGSLFTGVGGLITAWKTGKQTQDAIDAQSKMADADAQPHDRSTASGRLRDGSA